MRHLFRNTAVASLALWAAGAGAQTPDTGWYFGIGSGAANYSDNIPPQIAAAYKTNATYELLGARTIDGVDTATQIVAGYRFLPWLGAELGFQDLGNARTLYILHVIGPNLIPPTTYPLQPNAGEYRTRNFNAALVAALPIGARFELLARGGVADSRLSYDEHGIDFNGVAYAFHAPTRTHVSVQAGIGAQWKFMPSFAVRLDLDRNFDVGKKFALKADSNGRFDHVDAYTLNLVWKP